MDKYLSGSPSQLSQHFDNENYNSQDIDQFNDDFPNDFDDSDLSNLMLESNKSWSENFDQNFLDNTITDNSHSQNHKSNNSMISLNHDLPTFPNSHSIESIPQLTSSLSNQSLSDSPISFQKQSQPVVPHSNTPRRPNRNKSLSFSSANIYTTPLRTNGTQHSPINLITTTTTKINKTPHTSKKGHIRSRSRISLDLQPNLLLNPFYNPGSSFISPKIDKLDDNDPDDDDDDDDDVATPLPTPSSSQSLRSSSYNQIAGAMFSPTNLPGSISSNSKNQLFNSASATPFPLKRNDTLESIKIEDQDDDAFKQLKKAKSYSSIPSANTRIMNKENSYPNISLDQNENFFNAADLSLRLENHLINNDYINRTSGHSTPGVYYDDSPNYANQRSLQQQTILSGQHQQISHHQLSQKYTQQQLTQQYTQQQFSNFQQQLSQQLQLQLIGKPYPLQHPHSAPELHLKSAGIDLLSGKFHSHSGFDDSIDKYSKSATKNLNQSTVTNSFTKSYPACIDLASMTTSPANATLAVLSSSNQSNYYQQNNNMIHRGSFNNQSNLLPPMATFSIPPPQNHQVQNPQQIQQQQHQSQSRSLNQEIIKTAPMAKSVQEALMAPNFNIDIPIVKSNRLDKTDKIDPKKKHKCPICDSRFQRPEHVKRHLKSHSSEKPFQCDETDCGKRFNRKDNLKAHLKKIHQRDV